MDAETAFEISRQLASVIGEIMEDSIPLALTPPKGRPGPSSWGMPAGISPLWRRRSG